MKYLILVTGFLLHFYTCSVAIAGPTSSSHASTINLDGTPNVILRLFQDSRLSSIGTLTIRHRIVFDGGHYVSVLSLTELWSRLWIDPKHENHYLWMDLTGQEHAMKEGVLVRIEDHYWRLLCTGVNEVLITRDDAMESYCYRESYLAWGIWNGRHWTFSYGEDPLVVVRDAKSGGPPALVVCNGPGCMELRVGRDIIARLTYDSGHRLKKVVGDAYQWEFDYKDDLLASYKIADKTMNRFVWGEPKWIPWWKSQRRLPPHVISDRNGFYVAEITGFYFADASKYRETFHSLTFDGKKMSWSIVLPELGGATTVSLFR